MGKTNYNAIKNNTRKLEPLVSHFEYLMNLGKVRATRVVSTLVDGMGSHDNCDARLDVTYLPISMGYRLCYRRWDPYIKMGMHAQVSTRFNMGITVLKWRVISAHIKMVIPILKWGCRSISIPISIWGSPF